MQSPKYAVYGAAKPYFDLVRGALGDLVDGEHFFDIVTDDIVYEVLYDVAAWPRIIQGRADLMAQFRGYCDNIELQSADGGTRRALFRATDRLPHSETRARSGAWPRRH